MEALILIVAFWLMLVGGYGAYSLVAASRRRRAPALQGRPPAEAHTAQARRRPRVALPPVGLASEVDMLRAQIEHLRSEVVALSETAPRQERSRRRRYRTGAYTELPRSLRREVHNARQLKHTRHPLRV